MQAELLHHDVEGAELAAVAPEHPLDVEGRRVEAVGHRRYLGGRDEQEHGSRVHEAPDQPGAGDAVDLRPGVGHPHRTAAGVPGRKVVGADQQAAGRRPGVEPALQRLGGRAEVAQPGRDTLAELLAALADDSDRPGTEPVRPVSDGVDVAPHRAR